MTFLKKKKRYIICLLVILIISCPVSYAKASAIAKTLNLRNATDSLMLLIELETESGDDYVRAKAVHAELLREYIGHMEDRHLYWLLRLPPFSKNNVVKLLKSVAEDLEKKVFSESEAREKIEAAAKTIAKFLTDSKPFPEESITTFGPEAMSEEIKNATERSLKDSHEKVELYANEQTIDNSKAACMANRRGAVYLYLARFECQNFVSQEELKKFRTDINRTIYYNRVLQQTDAVKAGEGVEYSDYRRLDGYSDSERNRLRLLQSIIDNDMQEALVLLKTAIEEAIPGIKI